MKYKNLYYRYYNVKNIEIIIFNIGIWLTRSLQLINEPKFVSNNN